MLRSALDTRSQSGKKKTCAARTRPFLQYTAQVCCSQDRDQRSAAATRSFPVGNVPRSEHAQWCVRGYGRNGERRVHVFAREAENNTGRQATGTEHNITIYVRLCLQARDFGGENSSAVFLWQRALK